MATDMAAAWRANGRMAQLGLGDDYLRFAVAINLAGYSLYEMQRAGY